MANTLKLHRNGDVGFIDWLDLTHCEITRYFQRHVSFCERVRDWIVSPRRSFGDRVQRARLKAPFAKCVHCSVIKYRVASGSSDMDGGYSAVIGVNYYNENSGSGDMMCAGVEWIIGFWRVLHGMRGYSPECSHLFCGHRRVNRLAVSDKDQQAKKGPRQLHRPNETKLSHGYRDCGVQWSKRCKWSCGNFLAGRRFAGAHG